ncbi:MAG: TlyA family RNA methyltransferase [Limnochordia bacterium]
MSNKMRLDTWLVRQGWFESREQARRSVLAGEVYVNGRLESKPGTSVASDAEIELRRETPRYVSRGGLKLEKGLSVFALTVAGRNALDVGASTGGFTDCLLQHGARHVWAVDVGYGQLDWKLRNDTRVTVLERTNIRYLEPDRIPPVDIATIDVSFISLNKVLPAVVRLLGPEGDIVALVKPQFEAGRQAVGKRGVIRDPRVHVQVLEGVVDCAHSLQLATCAVTHSPIKGPQGNIEFLMHLSPRPQSTATDDVKAQLSTLVDQAHRELNSAS